MKFATIDQPGHGLVVLNTEKTYVRQLEQPIFYKGNSFTHVREEVIDGGSSGVIFTNTRDGRFGIRYADTGYGVFDIVGAYRQKAFDVAGTEELLRGDSKETLAMLLAVVSTAAPRLKTNVDWLQPFVETASAQLALGVRAGTFRETFITKVEQKIRYMGQDLTHINREYGNGTSKGELFVDTIKNTRLKMEYRDMNIGVVHISEAYYENSNPLASMSAGWNGSVLTPLLDMSKGNQPHIVLVATLNYKNYLSTDVESLRSAVTKQNDMTIKKIQSLQESVDLKTLNVASKMAQPTVVPSKPAAPTRTIHPIAQIQKEVDDSEQKVSFEKNIEGKKAVELTRDQKHRLITGYLEGTVVEAALGISWLWGGTSRNQDYANSKLYHEKFKSIDTEAGTLAHTKLEARRGLLDSIPEIAQMVADGKVAPAKLYAYSPVEKLKALSFDAVFLWMTYEETVQHMGFRNDVDKFKFHAKGMLQSVAPAAKLAASQLVGYEIQEAKPNRKVWLNIFVVEDKPHDETQEPNPKDRYSYYPQLYGGALILSHMDSTKFYEVIDGKDKPKVRELNLLEEIAQRLGILPGDLHIRVYGQLNPYLNKDYPRDVFTRFYGPGVANPPNVRGLILFSEDNDIKNNRHIGVRQMRKRRFEALEHNAVKGFSNEETFEMSFTTSTRTSLHMKQRISDEVKGPTLSLFMRAEEDDRMQAHGRKMAWKYRRTQRKETFHQATI